MMRLLTFCLVALAFLAGCYTLSESPKSSQDFEIKTVYLVRHAEKANGSRDPELSAIGLERAERLSNLLEHVSVDALWSSDYVRTRQTLKPLASKKNKPINTYDVRDSRKLVYSIMNEYGVGTHVIAGHSNTIPALVDIFESWPNEVVESDARANLGHEEYDLLYIVRFKPDLSVSVEEHRY